MAPLPLLRSLPARCCSLFALQRSEIPRGQNQQTEVSVHLLHAAQVLFPTCTLICMRLHTRP